ncbi:hypothetical protein VNO78_08490 [Psophocarpus tetragonolobus]|uniref:Uncharacterized protein n=1 Tax=Psophocarpus tetragonolobus TaxID=3891 RepID=A0AAN9SVA3_PSOTE
MRFRLKDYCTMLRMPGFDSAMWSPGNNPRTPKTKQLACRWSCPPRTAVWIPFKWLGKPRPCHTRSEPKGSGGDVTRSMEIGTASKVFGGPVPNNCVGFIPSLTSN